MATIRKLLMTGLFSAALCASPAILAADDFYQRQQQYEQMLKRQVELQKEMESARYRRQVGDKALLGFANMATGPLEVPKNIVNVYNYPENYQEANLIYGVVGGVIKGTFDAAGRIISGAFDVVTAPLPTKQVVSPRYVWDDFDKSNSYGQIFRLVDNPKVEPYIPPPPVATVEPEPVQTYSDDVNKQLDTMFQKEMMK